MSKVTWAKIVYGRSFHLDFRFITIPKDFVSEDLAWASQHILATTHQAHNLSKHPRWSLFRNNTHCIMGVTCMVRDLIGQTEGDSIKEMTNDDQGRPLYVFVGYVTKLKPNTNLGASIPAYTGKQLDTFRPLYQQVAKNWLVKDYESEAKNPVLSQYQTCDFPPKLINSQNTINQTILLNHDRQSPKQIYFWSDSPEHNKQLWLAAAKCREVTSVCLAVKGRLLADSPFINQTTTQVAKFTVGDRLEYQTKSHQPKTAQSAAPNNQNIESSLNFSDKISAKAQEDFNLTLDQAIKIVAVSQDFINQISDRSDSLSMLNEEQKSDSHESENFGFKTKDVETPAKKPDWF